MVDSGMRSQNSSIDRRRESEGSNEDRTSIVTHFGFFGFRIFPQEPLGHLLTLRSGDALFEAQV